MSLRYFCLVFRNLKKTPNYTNSIVYAIQDKERWEEKIKDEKIVAKWRKEAEQQNIGRNFERAVRMEDDTSIFLLNFFVCWEK